MSAIHGGPPAGDRVGALSRAGGLAPRCPEPSVPRPTYRPSLCNTQASARSDARRVRSGMDRLLIEAVHRREPIWNPASHLHKNSNILKRMWQEVGAELHKDAITAKTRWKNLRSYYLKECQKVNNRSAKGGDPTSTWQYYDQLHFLRGTLDGQKQNGTQEEYEGDEIFITNLDGPMSYPESPGQSSTEASNSTPTRKRKIKLLTSSNDNIDSYTLLELERRKLSILESEMVRSSNDDLLFFESLLPYLKDMPLERKLRLRSKIQDLICSELNVQEEVTVKSENFSY
ncbi:unnamed protein product, partial [Iphiclides podalirius]